MHREHLVLSLLRLLQQNPLLYMRNHMIRIYVIMFCYLLMPTVLSINVCGCNYKKNFEATIRTCCFSQNLLCLYFICMNSYAEEQYRIVHQVKPVIKLLKQTLVGTGALLVSAVSLFIFAAPVEDFLHSAFRSNDNNLNSATSQIKPNLRLALTKVL